MDRLSKKIHKIRKAMGYATQDQIKKGWEGEKRSCNSLIKMIKDGETTCVSSGGFTYKKLKNGKIVIAGEWFDVFHMSSSKDDLERDFIPGTHNNSRIVKVKIEEVK